MTPTVQMHRSTLLADTRSDGRARRAQRVTASAHLPPVVKVGGVGTASRTMVGSASRVVNRAYAPIGVRVGQVVNASVPAGTTVVAPSGATGTVTPGGIIIESNPPEKKSVSGTIAKVGAWALLGTMIAGPPAVGYLIAGKVGLVVGAVVAAPMAILYTMSLFDVLPSGT